MTKGRPSNYRAQASALVAQARKCSRDADVLAKEGKFEEGRRLLSEAKRLLDATDEIYRRLADGP